MFVNRNFTWNTAVISTLSIFIFLSFASVVESAQTVKQTKSASAPTKKKTSQTPARSAKTTVKPQTPKVPARAAQQSGRQLIATAAGSRIRAKATTSSSELGRVKLGTLVNIVEKTSNDWYRIEIPGKPKSETGWMSGQVADDWDANRREEIYLRILKKNYRAEQMSFLNASELFDFLNKVVSEIKDTQLMPDLEFKRLLVLRLALKAIPFGHSPEKPYKDFVDKNEKSIVFSEPAGEWYVRSDLFWDLRTKYAKAEIAEDIARTAAGNPLPGECEGYVNCYLFIMRETDGQYLDLYPNGKYAAESLKNIQNLLGPIAADLSAKQVFSGPTDVSDRAEFNRLIAEIRTIVSKLPLSEPEKQKTIEQLIQIAEGFR